MKNSDHDQSQLFKTQVDDLSSTKSKFNAESSMDIDNPCLVSTCLSAKLGQSMCVQSSKDPLPADKCYLIQKGTRMLLKDLLRVSNSYYRGPIINIEILKGIKSLL